MATEEFDRLKRQLRVLMIASCAARAGMNIVGAKTFHAIAYLANALAPVWRMSPLNAEVLRLTGSPYDPELQLEIDVLVGRGLLLIDRVSYEQDAGAQWRLEADYRLNRALALPVIDLLLSFDDERDTYSAILEVCLSLAPMDENEIVAALLTDASYSDESAGPGTVIELFKDGRINESARVASKFARILGGDDQFPVPSEEVNLYIRHLYRLATRTA